MHDPHGHKVRVRRDLGQIETRQIGCRHVDNRELAFRTSLTAASSATRVIVTSADLLPPKITQVPQTPTNHSNDSHICEIHTLETKLKLESVSNPRADSILVIVKTNSYQGDIVSFETDFFPPHGLLPPQ